MSTSSPRLGFIGIGLMGRPMTLRLLRAGHDVTVWNRTAEKLAAVTAAGARAAADAEEVAVDSDIIFMCVTDTDAVAETVFGARGIASGGAAGKLLVDHSSIRPEATRDMAARLRQETGMGWVDAPVSGGVPGAEAGTLAIMAGGEDGEVARATAAAAPMCARFTHMGRVGAGQVTKLINQIIVTCGLTVLAEAVALADTAGVDASRLTEALKGGFADSIPFQLFAPRMVSGAFDPPLGHLHTMMKDVTSARDLGRALGASLPMTELAADIFARAAAAGHSEDDVSSLIALYR